MPSDTDAKLLPCPFCGSEAKVERHYRTISYDAHDGLGYSAGVVIDETPYCQNPRCRASRPSVNDWNTRPQPAPQGEPQTVPQKVGALSTKLYATVRKQEAAEARVAELEAELARVALGMSEAYWLLSGAETSVMSGAWLRRQQKWLEDHAARQRQKEGE